MNPRTQKILEAVIKEFMATGQPVSSGYLYKKYDFGAKPATIRNELNFLDEENFLEQPHTSGGRLPTDKAYRFLVEQITADFLDEIAMAADKMVSALRAELTHQNFDGFVGDVAEELEILGVGYSAGQQTVYKSGLDYLFKNLMSDFSFNSIADTFQIIEDFEMLDERIADLDSFITKDSEPKVFIGKSPITKSNQLSVIADRYQANGEDFILAIVGPKRMDYERNIGFLKKLKKQSTNSKQ